jgi:hypothetical protein
MSFRCVTFSTSERLSSLQPTLTITSGNYVGNFIAENMLLLSPLNVVSLITVPQVCFDVLTAVSTKMAVFWVVAIALMMEAVQTTETSVNSYQSTRRYNPEDGHLRTLPYSLFCLSFCFRGVKVSV